MAKRGIVKKAIDSIKSVVEDAAVAAATTRSAGKPSLADLGVPVPSRAKRRTKKKSKGGSRARKSAKSKKAALRKSKVPGH